MNKPAQLKRGPGRPAVGSEVMKSRTIRTTNAEWDKCLRLGGAAWLRQRIKLAEDPAAPRPRVAAKLPT